MARTVRIAHNRLAVHTAGTATGRSGVPCPRDLQARFLFRLACRPIWPESQPVRPASQTAWLPGQPIQPAGPHTRPAGRATWPAGPQARPTGRLTWPTGRDLWLRSCSRLVTLR